MNIERYVEIEDCFDGSKICDVIIDEPMTREWIERLRDRGTFQFFPSFARPFFKLETPHFIMKGVEGDSEVRVTFKLPLDESKVHFTMLIEELNA